MYDVNRKLMQAGRRASNCEFVPAAQGLSDIWRSLLLRQRKALSGIDEMGIADLISVGAID